MYINPCSPLYNVTLIRTTSPKRGHCVSRPGSNGSLLWYCAMVIWNLEKYPCVVRYNSAASARDLYRQNQPECRAVSSIANITVRQRLPERLSNLSRRTPHTRRNFYATGNFDLEERGAFFRPSSPKRNSEVRLIADS
jgi:hypothetical protein